jgi:hypothetical protein
MTGSQYWQSACDFHSRNDGQKSPLWRIDTSLRRTTTFFPHEFAKINICGTPLSTEATLRAWHELIEDVWNLEALYFELPTNSRLPSMGFTAAGDPPAKSRRWYRRSKELRAETSSRIAIDLDELIAIAELKGSSTRRPRLSDSGTSSRSVFTVFLWNRYTGTDGPLCRWANGHRLF